MHRHLAFALFLSVVVCAVPARGARGAAPQIEVVAIPAGSFSMGSTTEPDEGPQHDVTITKPFSIGKYEVTQAQWTAVMGGKNPSQFTGGERPVERVTWDEAVAFCAKLSALSGKRYRLPTEAEWEYVCRAGTKGAWSFGDDGAALARFGWFDANGQQQTHAVGSRKPNAWGAHDMHGNVWEWCSDWYSDGYYRTSPKPDPRGPEAGEFRVMRGGSYGSDAAGCRSSNRFYATGDQRYFATGLRVVLETS